MVAKKEVYESLDHLTAHGPAVPPSHLVRRKRTFFLLVLMALSLNLNCVSHCSRKVFRFSIFPSKDETEILKLDVAVVVMVVVGGLEGSGAGIGICGVGTVKLEGKAVDMDGVGVCEMMAVVGNSVSEIDPRVLQLVYCH